MNVVNFRVALVTLGFKVLFRGGCAIGAWNLAARFAQIFATEIDAQGRECQLNAALFPPAKGAAAEKSITLLFLNRPHFPEVPQTLSSLGRYRCLSLSWTFQRYLMAMFVRNHSAQELNEINKSYYGERHYFHLAAEGSSLQKRRRAYRVFLRKFLPVFFGRLGVDLVINSDARYRREADISRVASELGYPHIVFNRESMYIARGVYDMAVWRHRRLGQFQGDVLHVQNCATKQMFLDAGYAQDRQIFVGGAFRLDEFVKTVAQPHYPACAHRRRRIVFFTWPRCPPTPDNAGIDTSEVARMTARAVARIARRKPDIEVIIKFKVRHVSGLKNLIKEEIDSVFAPAPVPERIRYIVDEIGATDLILSASAVCAMQSTTVLEAALSRIPVILPFFRVLRETNRAAETLMFYDVRHLFDVPDDEDDLVRLLYRRLYDDAVPDEVYRQWCALYESYVGPTDGGCLDKTLTMIDRLVEKGRCARGDGHVKAYDLKAL